MKEEGGESKRSRCLMQHDGQKDHKLHICLGSASCCTQRNAISLEGEMREEEYKRRERGKKGKEEERERGRVIGSCLSMHSLLYS